MNAEQPGAFKVHQMQRYQVPGNAAVVWLPSCYYNFSRKSGCEMGTELGKVWVEDIGYPSEGFGAKRVDAQREFSVDYPGFCCTNALPEAKSSMHMPTRA